MNFSITQNGKKLAKSKYNWNEDTLTFSSNENNLILDFSGISGVTFKTRNNCTFITRNYCNFITGNNCTFITRNNCIFDTGHDCKFNTKFDCTFKTNCNCNFKTGRNCVIIRRDVFEIIEPKVNKTIKLNDFGIKSFTYVKKMKTIIINDKTIEISEESFENLRAQLL